MLRPKYCFFESVIAEYWRMDREEHDRWLIAARRTVELDRRSKMSLSVAGEDTVRFRSMYPIARHALAQVGAALTLHDTGRSFEASANARVALEHALLAQWIVLTADSETLLANSIDKSHSLMLRGLEPFAQSIPADLRPLLVLPTAARVPPMDQICGRFDRSGLLYTMYRGLTGAVHLSGASVAEYVSVNGETGAIVLHPKPRSRMPPTDFEKALGWAAVLAKAALEMLLDDDSDLVEVAAIARNAGLPHDLSFDDRYPERQPQNHPQSENM